MTSRRCILFTILILATITASSPSFAQSLPNDFTVEGRLYQTDGVTPETSNVDIVLEVLNDVAADTCVLYSETWPNVTLNSANPNVAGSFALRLGAGTPNGGFAAPNLSALFASGLPINGFTEIGAGDSYGATCPRTPAATDHRVVRVKVRFAGPGTYALLTPDTRITAVPTAIVAENANALNGLPASSFLLSNTNASSALNQPNVENIFTANNYAKLVNLLAPTASVGFGGQTLTSVGNPINPQDAATKSYSDGNLAGSAINLTGLAAGKTLVWNSGHWDVATVATVSYIKAGNGLNGGIITTTGTVSVDTGTAANQILQLNTSAQIPAVDGFLLTNINAAQLRGHSLSAAAPGAGQVLAWNNSSALWEPTSPSGGTITALTGDVAASGSGSVVATIQPNAVTSTKINNAGVAVNRLLITDATTGATVGYSTCGGLGELLQWTASGWACTTVTTVLGPSGVTAATYGNSIQVAQVGVDPQGRVTALTNVNIAFPVTSVASRTGAVTLNAADIGGLGTAATQDYGTGANQLLPLNASAQLPAVDASLLTNVNATKLQSRDVSAAAPGAGQVLGWNTSSSMWEPVSVGVGSVTSIFAGSGLLGGTITSAGTLSVDVGTVANKILQLNTSAQIPAVDGFLVTNVNASKIIGKSLSGVVPTAGQILTYNNLSAQWEAQAPSPAAADFVNGGNNFGAPSSLGNKDPFSLTVLTNNAARMTFDNAGNVGIGTTTPNALLDVAGILRVTTICDSSGASCKTVSSGWGAGGSVTNVSAGTGLLGGNITTAGTLNVDVGTAGNKILQLNTFAQIPAVDGSLLSNLNASRIGTHAVSSAAPGAGQYMGWNSSSSQWEPLATTTGTVTNVVSGLGLLGGPISSIGTLSVDVGTSANKILQVTSTTQYPVLDGNLITNVNAVNIRGRNVSSIGPTDAQVLLFNSTTSTWLPGSLSGDGIITNLGALTVAAIQGKSVKSGTPGAGQVLTWNNSTTQWDFETSSGGSVTQVVSGTGLLAGTITNAGTINVDVGTTANKILQITAGTQYPAVDGNLITNTNAYNIRGVAVSATAPADKQMLLYNSTTANWTAVTIGTDATITDSGAVTVQGLRGKTVSATAPSNAQLLLYNNTTSTWVPGSITGDGSITNLGALTVAAIQGKSVKSGTPGAGQVLTWNNSTTQWDFETSSGGSVTQVVSGTGLVVGTITNLGTINVDVGTTANKILQLTSGAQIPAVDGYLVTNVNAQNIQGKSISSTTPTDAQILTFNNSWGKWAPVSASGDITMVNTGAVTVSGIQGRAVSSTAPIDGQILLYNSTSTKYTPISLSGAATISDTGSVSLTTTGATGAYINGGNSFAQVATIGTKDTNNFSLLSNNNVAMTITTTGNVGIGTTTPQALLDVSGTMRVTTICDSSGGNCKNVSGGWGAGGSVTDISGGTGLTGGNISTAGTLNVDVGTAANKILQVTSLGQYPAVDGNLIGNINAVKLQARNVSATAPVGGQVLGFNSTSNQWEPSSVTSGTVTSVNSGTGLTGGAITANGTLNVDVGTAANKILQLTSTAQIPGVDGFLVTNVNAGKLIGKSISGTVPTGAQVLTYNSTSVQWEAAAVSPPSFPLLASPIGTAAAPAYSFLGYTNTGFFGTGANGVAVSTFGTERMRVDSSGNVGIGTTTPGFPLDVTGNMQVSGYITSNGGQSFSERFGALSSVSGPNALAVGNSAQSVASGVAVGRGALVNSSGGVAVGFIATAGGGINGVAVGQSALANGASAVAVGYSSVAGANGTALGASANAPANSLAIQWASGSGSINGNSSGNVGVGTTAPQAGLDVATTGTLASAIIVPRDTTANRPSTAVNGMIRYASNTSKFEAYQNGAWTNMISSGGSSSGTAGAIQYSDGAGGFLSNNNIFIDGANGRVGIGTAAPQALLDVSGTGTFSAIIVPRDTTANRPTGVNGMLRYNTNTNAFEGFANSAWAALGGGSTSFPLLASPIGTAAAPAYSFLGNTNTGFFGTGANGAAVSTAGTERMRIDSSGNVGIGTTSAADVLVVQRNTAGGTNIDILNPNSGVAAYAGINLGNNVSSTQANIFVNSSAATNYGGSNALTFYNNGASPIVFYTNAQDRLHLDGSGNVGIGTTTPGAKLEVNGALRLDGSTSGYLGFQAPATVTTPLTFTLPNGDGGAGTVLSTNGSGVLFWATVPVTGGSDTIAAGSAIAPSLNFTGDTTTGLYDAAVGTIGVSVSGTEKYAITASSIASTTTGGALMTSGNGTAAAPVFSFAGDTGTGWFRPAASMLAASTGGTERVRIDNNGNVGIGTTSPQATLDVYGGIDINGTTGIFYPADSFAMGASIGIGVSALVHQNSLASTVFRNTAIGYQSMSSASMTTAATNNTALGFQALQVNTSGANNTSLGNVALSSNTTGSNNTAIGVSAGVINSSGNFNTAVGAGALDQNSTGSNNTTVGYRALFSTTGSSNTGIGFSAGSDVTTGAQNIFLGYYPTSGVGVTTGSNNILIGYDVRPASQTASNQLNIGNLIYATGLASGTTASTGNIGIGTTSPSSSLSVTSSSGTNGTVAAFKSTGLPSAVLSISDNSTTMFPVGIGSSGNDMYLYSNNAGAIKIAGTSNQDVNIYPHVMIGATASTPGRPLEVINNINSTYASNSVGSASPAGGAYNVPAVRIGNTTNMDNTAAYLELQTTNTATNKQTAYIASISSSGGSYSPAIAFGQQTGFSSYNERMRIDSTGNVGIGTATPNPGTALDVNGDIRGRHLAGNTPTPLAISVGTGAGGGAVVGSFTISGNDVAHRISFTSGTAPVASSLIVTVSFSGSGFTSAPVCVFSPGTAAAASAQVIIGPAMLQYTLTSGAAPLSAGTLYWWYVHCLQ